MTTGQSAAGHQPVWGWAALAASLGVSCLVMSVPVVAQEPGVRVEEIVVTARKREEQLSDVPVSASLLTASEMDDMLLRNTSDVIQNIPGAIIATSGVEFLDDIVMRGQGAGRGAFSESASGLYRDGTFVAGGAFSGRTFDRMELFDLERIEAFRGAQGGMFGRNAMGGAINLLTARPTVAPEAALRASLDSVDRRELAGHVSGPLLDNALRARLSGIYVDQRDGHIDNEFDGRVLDRQDYWGLRASIEAEPTESFTVFAQLERYESSLPSFSAVTHHPNSQFGRFTRNFNGPSKVDIDRTTAMLELVWATDWAEIRSSTMYEDKDGFREDDLDWFSGGLPVQLELLARFGSEYERWNQELVFSSTDPNADLTWLAGFEFISSDEVIENETIGFAGAIDQVTTLDDRSYSAFAALDYRFSPAWAGTLELRATRDRKKAAIFRTSNFPATLGNVLLDVEDRQTFTNVKPVATLTYTTAQGQLIYGRLASGFRAGGFNQVPPAGAPFAFDEEQAISAELGTKLGFLDDRLRLEAALFHMWTDDIQAVTRGPSEFGNIFFLQNAGDGRLYGAELEMRGRFEVAVTGGMFDFRVGAAAMTGEYSKGQVQDTVPGEGLVTFDIDGNDLPRLRDLSLSLTTRYSHPLGAGAQGFAMLNVRHDRGGVEDTLNRRTLENFTIVDARIGLRRGPFSASVFARNLFDEIYLVEESPNQLYYNTPRTWGAELRYRWGG